MNTVTFNGWNCKAIITKYADGNAAILLEDASTGEPIATASVNIPEANVADGFVIVKDYSENEGMLDALTEAGIVSFTGSYINSGFIEAPLCELNPNLVN